MATLKAWTGAAWKEIASAFKVWTGAAFVEKPAYYWNGDEWILIGGGAAPWLSLAFNADAATAVMEKELSLKFNASVSTAVSA